jgi:uncharacterized protein (DUF433 family)
MMNVLAALLATLVSLTPALAAPPQAAGGVKPVIDNDRVTVWDIAIDSAMPDPAALRANDAVIVFIAPDVIQGVAEYMPKGAGVAERLKASGAERAAVISLKDHAAPAVENTSGYPEAFPRRGARIVFANTRVAVWDNALISGMTPTMHFHSTDVVTVYLTDATIVSTTPDGTETKSMWPFGTIRFNQSNRTHSEAFPAGDARTIAVEIK